MSLKEHSINQLNNFMGGWFINESICDELIDYHKQSNNKVKGRIYRNNTRVEDKSVKDSTDCILENKLLLKYTQSLQEALNEYIKKYSFCNFYSAFTINEPVNIQHYMPNGGFKVWHTERQGRNMPETARHLVFMTYLNDVTDEGETEFYYQKLKVKPQKGLTLIWNPDWTFTHRGIPSKTQEKYIVTGWYSFI